MTQELANDMLEYLASTPEMRRAVFRSILRTNMERCFEWHAGAEPWSIADSTNAVAGEAGELSNKAKKIRRLETFTNAHRKYEGDINQLRRAAAEEAADVFIYLQIALYHLAAPETVGFNLYDEVAMKFNATSVEFGFEHRMPL